MIEKKNFFTPKKFFIFLIILFLAGGLFFFLKKNVSEKVQYVETKVSKNRIEVTILSTGIVQPQNRLEIKPPIAGRIENVLVQEGQIVKKGQTLAWMSSTEMAALLDAARARGAEELKIWSELYKKAPIIAPISGTIILRNVEPGQTFTTSDAILVMSDRLIVKAQVDETDIAKIKKGQKANVILDAYSDKNIPSHVDKIAYEATTINNVTIYIVDVLPEKVPDFMKSGMTANVTFTVEVKEAVLTIPTEAIKQEDEHFYVLVPDAKDKEKIIKQTVKLGVTDGKVTELVSGLKENDMILIPQIKQEGASQTGTNPFMPIRRSSRRR